MTTESKPLTPAELDAIKTRANAVNTRGYHPSDVEASQEDVPRLVAEVRRQAEEIDHLRHLHSRALDAAKAAAGHLAEHRRSKTGSKEEFAACSVDEVVEILSHD